ncbi:MAG: hypothetical protein IRZ18_05345 [Clostridia bacterium]|nr:hypothetical protein [Clostridia bacterium]
MPFLSRETLQLERWLSSLPGVQSARVSLGEGGVERVHLLITGDPAAAVSDAHTLVYTLTGRRLPADAIVVTPVGPSGVWDEEGRWRLAEIGVVREEGDVAEVTVRLTDGDRVNVGQARGGADRELRLTALATVRALEAALGEGVMLALVDLQRIRLAGQAAFIAALHLEADGDGRTLLGIAAVQENERTAAARVVLDAANRAFR